MTSSMDFRARLQGDFETAERGNRPVGKGKPSPFSIRLNEDERAYLQEMAGSRPLGAYIRERLLGDRELKRRSLRKPQMGEYQYASLLAALGESRLSSNVNQLAKHANMGTLDVDESTEAQLEEAYQAILAMREALFMALGLKSGGDT
tara:strand:+ start:395 stop:838 length:444 start_codon:yes stop_codon:yes gene_type:complete